MPRLSALLLALAAAVVPCTAAAQLPRSFDAVVTHVTDGDTLWVRPSWGAAPIQLRLHGIDAPESCQPWGPQARHALAQRLLHQPVRVSVRGRDDYQRTLARVAWLNQDTGAWLVFNGLAWSPGYRRAPGPYAELQSQARAARRGLWADVRAVEPRTFRRQHGPCAPRGES